MNKIDYKIEELILSVNDVDLSYDSKRILNNINIDIHNITRPNTTQGQIVSICGRSGIGKSSLFKLLTGFQKPDKGEIRIGVDQHHIQMGEVGIVPQDYKILNHRTIYDNLSIAMGKNKDKKDIIHGYAEYFELTPHLQKFPGDLSGGQRQRASILQQVLTGNQFILFDEPFSGLDSLMKDKVIELLLKVSCLHELNTLIIVSHDIESSCAISDTVFIMAKCEGDNQGATITKKYDFLEMGLAYHENIREIKEFQDVIKNIKKII
jgi:ABC-type nitrate/sulfonate/bicarbonate transport system ATPase subunit